MPEANGLHRGCDGRWSLVKCGCRAACLARIAPMTDSTVVPLPIMQLEQVNTPKIKKEEQL